MDKYRTLKVDIIGTAPLIMHNGQTADPLNRYAKAMAEISGKRSKTEADLEQMAWLDFIGSLYMGTDGPVVPGRLIEAAIVEGAKKSKLGKLATAGVIVEQNPAVQYEGPRTARELFADEAFRFSVPVRVRQSRIVRCRPIFREWALAFEVAYHSEVINARDIETAIRNGGMFCGIGDWRPRYGRFSLRKDLPTATAAE